MDGATWNEIASLLENDFDLIIPDLHGMGQSNSGDKTYTVAELASDVTGLLDHLKIQKTFIAGHSMGGYVALAFPRAYPNRVPDWDDLFASSRGSAEEKGRAL